MSQSDYVVVAYGVVFVTLLVYVVIIAAKLARLERETAALAELARKRDPGSIPSGDPSGDPSGSPGG